MSVLRPPYIIAHYADAAGCGHHRILRPMEILAKNGMVGGRCDMNLWPDDRLKAIDPDVVVFQRQHEDTQIEAIKRYREALPNAFIVYELDDILSAVPPWSIHHSFIPHDIDERMRRAIEHCHAVSVSTKTLAEHIKKVCGENTDVRILPNMLGKDELAKITEIRKNQGLRVGKPRIGWGGGISHKGDLDLLIPAIKALHEKADFVFLGMKPDCDMPVEFHEGVPPSEFLSKLASLNLDLVVAPLVDCEFNRCKSNLRLLESGACGYPVIASRVQPYIEGQPPVFCYAEDNGWQAAIEKWLKDKPNGDKLQDWVLRKFTFDDKAAERLRGWLPINGRAFQPKQRSVKPSDTVFVTSGMSMIDKHRTVSTFVEVGDVNADVLYLRAGSRITDEQLARMKERLHAGKYASVSTFSNDGGACSFPKVGNFVPIDDNLGSNLDAVASKLFPGATMEIPFGSGPAILLSRRVIDLIGYPVDPPDPNDLEGTIIEWGVMAAARGFPNVVAADVYVAAAAQTVFERFKTILTRIALRWPPVQTPPDPLREARAHLEMAFHREYYSHPPLTAPNAYNEWSSYADELGSRDLDHLAEFILDTGETLAGWTVVVRDGAIEAPHARYEIARAIKANPEAVLVFGDHDFVNDDGERTNHDFKPLKLDVQMLYGRDYISPVFAIRNSARPEFFDSWYEAILETIEKYGSDKIVHVPLCLAHLKEVSSDEVAKLCSINVTTANKFFQTHGKHIVAHQHPLYKQYAELDYKVEGEPLVSIIIVTGGRSEMLSPCVGTLLSFTSYKNYEILIVTDGVVPPACQEYLESILDNPKVRIIAWPHAYNWSAKNNFAVKHTKGQYYLFLNDDTRFAEPAWLTQMVGAAQIPGTGTVGARMFYPSGQIQHIGVVCHGGLTGHLHKTLPGQLAGYNGLNVISHETTANTGACLLVSKERYEEVGGLDETFAHNFNDVAFCVEMNRRGYRHIVPAGATLQHLEGVTRLNPMTPEGMRVQINEGQTLGKLYPDEDPYWNWNLYFAHVGGNMFVTGLNFDVLQWPKKPWSWRDENWDTRTVLILGDGVDGLDEIRNGDSVYRARSYGYNIKIESPSPENVPPFDIRDLPRARAIINGFGITKIIVGTIAGGVIESLRFLLKIGVPIEYRPVLGEAVCPRLNFQPNGESCNGGYKRGMCGTCLDEHSSPFGEVNIAGWRDTWRTFLSAVRVDKSLLQAEGVEALSEVYDK